MDMIPRDLQLHIAKQFDMDTRIKTSLVFKLRVPQKVKDMLSATVCVPPSPLLFHNNKILLYEKRMGCRETPGFEPHIYSVRFIEQTSPLLHRHAEERWEVFHRSSESKVTIYTLDSKQMPHVWQVAKRW